MPENIATLLHALETRHQVEPRIGLEIEWYSLPRARSTAQAKDLLALLLFACKQADIPLYAMQQESAEHQYEVALQPLPAPEAIAQYQRFKKLLRHVHAQLHMQLITHPKPFADKPGSGLHVHISLHDKKGKNLFRQKKPETETSLMQHALGGLCTTMKNAMPIFAPHRWSMARFQDARNVPVGQATAIAHYNLAPTHICWGANNRTAALRIPASTRYPDTRRIEHRVPGADARIIPLITVILEGMLKGLDEKIMPPEKLHGNAYDAQYTLDPLV